ncbi:MAG: division/cell wall cluster transcriptional repressor MraZ [Acidimicrobiales bacterium]
MAKFFGRFEHSLDLKGRVILPSKFRPEFLEDGGFLSQFHEGCLALWTAEQFNREMQVREERAAESRDLRNLARVWASGSTKVDVDRQGRMFIPLHLREFAGLESDVLVHGAIDRVELWSPDNWQIRIKPMEARLIHGMDEQHDVGRRHEVEETFS